MVSPRKYMYRLHEQKMDFIFGEMALDEGNFLVSLEKELVSAVKMGLFIPLLVCQHFSN